MIFLTCGPPRAGKGLFIVQKALDTLLYSDDTIVTNFAFKIPELHEWIQIHYPDKLIDVPKRIHIIPDDEVKSFFLHRGFGQRITVTSKDKQERGTYLDFSNAVHEVESEKWEFREGWHSVHYILDEVDLAFSARGYAKNGAEFNFYNKQHGKLGDTVDFCCQSPAQIDKLIREVCQTTTILKNLGKLRVAAFKLPKVFSWSQYYQVPNGPNIQPILTGSFTIKSLKGLENCFRTQQGLGMTGISRADKGDRIKGLSVWWLVPVILLILYGTWKSDKFTEWLMKKMTPKTLNGSYGATPQPRRNQNVQHQAKLPADKSEKRQNIDEIEEIKPKSLPLKEPERFMTGWVLLGDRRIRIYLSDGTEITETDPLLTFVHKDYIQYDGKRINMKKPDYSTPPPKPKKRSPERVL